MIVVLRIAGAPPRQFYKDADSLPFLNAAEAKHALLANVGTLRATTQDESPSVTVSLTNRAGQCTKLFASPPIGAAAQLLDENGEIFAGVVKRITLGNDCRISIEA